jgi:deoxyribodipyrimidine photo-lyase
MRRAAAVHDPYHQMPNAQFKKLGYPEPLVDHKEVKDRALRRYKNVGQL